MSSLPYANKDLGQHFLKDRNVIETITSDFESKASAIIEIGPGPAILTEGLSKKGLPFYVIEKDTRFKERLLEFISEDQIIFTDALAFDLEKFIDEKKLENLWLVSNLPYNISAPLFMKFMPIQKIKYMTLMFQKEVALKILPYQGKDNTQSSLSLLSENFFESRHLIKALPGAFIPPPKVDSLVLSLIRKESPTIGYDQFKNYENFLRFIFKAKRKQLQKILKERLGADTNAILESLSIAPSIRAEALESFKIINLFFKVGSKF